MIAPLQKYINVVLWERKISCDGLDYNLHPRNNIKPMNILSQLIISPFQNHVMDILNEVNIKGSLPNPTRFNVEIGAVQRGLKRPQCGLWENAEHVLPVRDKTLGNAMQTEGRSIFLFRTGSHCLSTNH